MIVVGMLCAVLLAGYVAGYLILCKIGDASTSTTIRHARSSSWASFYEPAAWVESKINGGPVYLMYPMEDSL